MRFSVMLATNYGIPSQQKALTDSKASAVRELLSDITKKAFLCD